MEPAGKRFEATTVLPPDVMQEILLRVTAKPLCRFRAACRSWRALLSDQTFIQAHAARRPGPLLLAAMEDHRVDMMELSGNVVERIRIADDGTGIGPLRAHPGQLYLVRASNRVSVVDPATGAVSALPFDVLDDPATSAYLTWYALGRVASTGQRKVLRIVSRMTQSSDTRFEPVHHIEQLCDVLTINDGGEGDDRHFWRRRPSPPVGVSSDDIHKVVIQGIVYFLPHVISPSFTMFNYHEACNVEPDCVALFDLETEEWRPVTLRGPLSSHLHWDNTNVSTSTYAGRRSRFKLVVKLNGSLVMVHCNNQDTVDMWFLTDFGKGLWVKEHSIQKELLIRDSCFAEPLLVLEDGRIVFSVSVAEEGRIVQMEIYDPRTNTCTHVVKLADCNSIVGVYTGSLLYLERK